jgi:hypothetical protein
VRHIELGERHLNRGRVEHDPDFFNDVIYRTNQAFEGMLKEAYGVFEETDAKRLSPNEIEQYLVNNKRLSQRVLDLFKNYRQQWRNPATHDHTLLFSEQEALLAIGSVSAFAVVLLDQIVETISFKRQRAAIARKRDVLVPEILESDSFTTQLVSLLQLFVRHDSTAMRSFQNRAELLGALSGFLVGLQLNIRVTPEAQVAEGLNADLLVQRDNDAVIVEVKVGKLKPDYVQASLNQLRSYVSAANAGGGILFLASGRKDVEGKRVSGDSSDTELWIVSDQMKT